MMSLLVELLFYRGVGALPIYAQLKMRRQQRLRLPGLKHPVAMRNNSSDYDTFREVFLREDYRLPSELMPATIIDAGANIGLTSIYMADRYPEADIVSVEPDGENFALLTSNARPYPNIRPLHAGMWPFDNRLELVDTGEGPNSFQVRPATTAAINTLQAVSPHHIMHMRGWSAIDILKVDIEGAEHELFSSDTEKWLPHTRMLFVETHDRMRSGCTEALFRSLSAYHFDCTVFGENFLITNFSFRQL